MEHADGAVAGQRLLESLGGGEAPTELAADLSILTRLPAEALQKLWQVLPPMLADAISKEAEQLLDLFCVAYKVNEDDLGRALRACRFVIREACQRNVPAAGLARDLDGLCPGEPLVKELVLAGYEPAKEALRREMLHAAIADHGKLLVDVKWRLDSVLASERGTQLQVPVALLTLHFQEGRDTGRVTLQVLPDMMGQLRVICDQMLK